MVVWSCVKFISGSYQLNQAVVMDATVRHAHGEILQRPGLHAESDTQALRETLQAEDALSESGHSGHASHAGQQLQNKTPSLSLSIERMHVHDVASAQPGGRQS